MVVGVVAERVVGVEAEGGRVGWLDPPCTAGKETESLNVIL